MSTNTMIDASALAASGTAEHSNLPGRKTRATVVMWLLFAATALAIVVLALLIFDIASQGL
jgi:hypothetical protein